ncbi:hypothetical protein J4225_04085 [Candidatus Pacearchaeota archaeon]|nr:hypothetical protein [Candidatus Pacearchaeota archaeon]
MKRGAEKKGRLSATINPQTLKKFNEYCDKNSINKSQLLEKQIIKILKEVGLWQEK